MKKTLWKNRICNSKQKNSIQLPSLLLKIIPAKGYRIAICKWGIYRLRKRKNGEMFYRKMKEDPILRYGLDEAYRKSYELWFKELDKIVINQPFDEGKLWNTLNI